MLTRDIAFGMNVLTLAGLLVTGFGFTLHRMAASGRFWLLAGLYASGWPH